MMKIKYDLVLGLGNACSCSQILRAAGLQLLSFPFDWIVYDHEELHDLCARANMILNNFSGWLEKKDLAFKCRVDWHSKDVYSNTRTHVIFNHDFPKLMPLEETFYDVHEKYDRRIRRLYQCIKKARRILLVRVDRPDQVPPTPIDDCRETLRRLRERFSDKRLDMLLLQFDPNRTENEKTTEDCGDSITRIAFDYKDNSPGATTYAPDIPMVAKVLSDRYEVAEYRSRAEIKAKKQRSQLAKFRANGAENRWQYTRIKLRRRLAKLALRIHPRILQALIHAKKYEHIVTLGVNCEPAFRFYDTWHFVDSSLFAWAQCFNLKTLASALTRLDKFFAGDVELDPLSKMWICRNTGIYLHGQLKWGPGMPEPTSDDIEKDKADLRGRIAHLREKLVRYATDDKSTLFVHRLNEADEKSPRLREDLLGLLGSLESLGSSSFKLLVICERQFLSRMPVLPNCEFRFVEAFNPGHAITDTSLGDRVGWRAIFREFAPARVLPKKHTFKFE